MFAFKLLLLCVTKKNSKNYLEHANHAEMKLSLVVKHLYKI